MSGIIGVKIKPNYIGITLSYNNFQDHLNFPGHLEANHLSGCPLILVTGSPRVIRYALHDILHIVYILFSVLFTIQCNLFHMRHGMAECYQHGQTKEVWFRGGTKPFSHERTLHNKFMKYRAIIILFDLFIADLHSYVVSEHQIYNIITNQ